MLQRNSKRINELVRKEIENMPIHEYAPKERPRKVKADMSLNINPAGVSPLVMQKLRSLKETDIYHYYPENQELMRLVSKYIKAKPANILFGDGCDGCLELVAKTFISKGDRVIIPTPTFHRYEFHSRIMGGDPVFVEMPDFIYSAEAVTKMANQTGSKLIFLCNPNNPTGIEINVDEITKTLDAFDGIVVIDEALADSSEIETTRLLDKYRNLIVVRSFSKVFGLASLRIGYVVAAEEIITEIRKTTSPFKVNGLAQELAIEAIKDTQHIKMSSHFLQEERDYIKRELTRLGFSYTDSKTTNLLVDIEPIGKNADEVVEMLSKEEVLVTGASVFQVPQNKYIRIAISSKKENREFIEALSKICSNKLI